MIDVYFTFKKFDVLMNYQVVLILFRIIIPIKI